MDKLFLVDKKYFLSLFAPVVIFSLAVIFYNNRLFTLINQTIASSSLDWIFFYILVPLFLLLGIVPMVMLFSRNWRQLGLFCLVSGFLCNQIGGLTKLLFCLPRPIDVRLVGNWQISEFSFPSSTVMLAFGLALPILFEKPRYSFPFLIIASLVGFALIYSGYHSPYDVGAGVLLSLILVVLFKYFKNLVLKYV